MSLLKILKYPDKRLRIIANPVIKINKYIKRIINDMFDTMYMQEGIGLAATQINIHLQIIVIHDCFLKKPLTLINPIIKEKRGQINIEEGCLSIPTIKAIVPRSKYIKIEALNYFGKKIEINANSLLSVCIQHEMDHLIGKLFIDYLSKLKKEHIKKIF